MHFVAPTPTPKGLARRVPPAIFVPIMGIMGLGLAYRQAAFHWEALAAVSELILGAGTLLALFAIGAYGLKVARRVDVVDEEVRILPGRLGLSAMCVCLYLLAAAVGPFLGITGWLFLALGLILQLGVILAIAGVFRTQPPEARRFSPAGQLYFTSPVVATLASAALDAPTVAEWLLLAALVPAIIGWVWGALDLWRVGMSAPLRPLLMLHLAAASVSGSVALGLAWAGLAQAMAILSVLLAVALAISVPKLTEAPFSALWGAFTFPTAATAGFWLGFGGPLLWPGVAVLALASVVVPVIAFRILKMWLSGQLAIKTNAAIA